MMMGCTKFSDIFDDNNSEVVVPFTNDYLTEMGLSADYFYSDEFRNLAEAFLAENAPDDNEFAYVVNDARLIDNTGISMLSTIDFERFSLIVGQIPRTWDRIEYLKDTRVCKTLFGYKLYLHMVTYPGYVTQDAMFFHIPFGALYPRLPDGPIKVVRWDDF